MSPQHPTLLLVLGMHRSGTSAFTRTLNLLGADLPGTLQDSKPGENPLGFWEAKEIMEGHDAFLTAVGSCWDDMRPLPPAALQSTAATHLRDQLTALLADAFARNSILVVKDPRICRLLPLWLKIAQGLGARVQMVLPVRNPLEVALSLQTRNGFSRSKALILWLVHFIMAEQASRGHPRYFLGYAHFLNQPKAAGRELAQKLACFDPIQVRDSLGQIERFWLQDLRHHVLDDQAVLMDRAIPIWVRSVYQWALLAVQGLNPDPAGLDRIGEEIAHAMESMDSFVDPANLAIPDQLQAALQQQVWANESSRNRLDQATAALADREQIFLEQKADLQGQAAHIAGFTAPLRAKDQTIASQLAHITAQASDIAGLNARLCAKKDLLASHSVQIKGLESGLRHAAANLAQAQAQVRTQDQIIVRQKADLHRQNLNLRHLIGKLSLVTSSLAALHGEFAAQAHDLAQAQDDDRIQSHWEREQFEKQIQFLTAQIHSQTQHHHAALTALAGRKGGWFRKHFDRLYVRWILRGTDPTPLFDASYYLRQNPDVLFAGQDPLTHFLRHGWKEGRHPGPAFNLQRYCSDNPDVQAAKINPLLHYIRYGAQEGRALYSL